MSLIGPSRASQRLTEPISYGYLPERTGECLQSTVNIGSNPIVSSIYPYGLRVRLLHGRYGRK